MESLLKLTRTLVSLRVNIDPRTAGISAMKRIIATVAILSAAALAGAQEPGGMIEWPYVGSDQAHTKYSTADEITAANVGELKIVWQWEPNEMPLEK